MGSFDESAMEVVEKDSSGSLYYSVEELLVFKRKY
jgi:hypothetical protein